MHPFELEAQGNQMQISSGVYEKKLVKSIEDSIEDLTNIRA